MGNGRGRGAWNRGFGGGGRGWRNMFYASGLNRWMRFQKPDPNIEKQTLKDHAEALQSELDMIKKRLNEIDAPES